MCDPLKISVVDKPAKGARGRTGEIANAIRNLPEGKAISFAVGESGFTGIRYAVTRAQKILGCRLSATMVGKNMVVWKRD